MSNEEWVAILAKAGSYLVFGVFCSMAIQAMRCIAMMPWWARVTVTVGTLFAWPLWVLMAVRDVVKALRRGLGAVREAYSGTREKHNQRRERLLRDAEAAQAKGGALSHADMSGGGLSEVER